uniref:DUF1367 family protein n=2 Tax=Escherichia coli TaxID=562 RepID=UPI001F463DB2
MREKSLATSDESGILNAPALNPLRRVLFFPGILVYNSHASLNNWHLLRQQRQPMAHIQLVKQTSSGLLLPATPESCDFLHQIKIGE